MSTLTNWIRPAAIRLFLLCLVMKKTVILISITNCLSLWNFIQKRMQIKSLQAAREFRVIFSSNLGSTIFNADCSSLFVSNNRGDEGSPFLSWKATVWRLNRDISLISFGGLYWQDIRGLEFLILTPLFLPKTFTSKKSKMGVYYNPYFTVDPPHCGGRLIFAVILLPQYNTALEDIILQKRTITVLVRAQKGF